MENILRSNFSSFPPVVRFSFKAGTRFSLRDKRGRDNESQLYLFAFMELALQILSPINLLLLAVRKQYSRTSMARTSLGPRKFVRDIAAQFRKQIAII